ncbi:DUF4132 domain-containing protein [Actinomadura chibensis]|uniref:DUF4132 domain-containing protein n=1 Tax=Actinomadura chibensis TaxID=392828 RepID=A0A5D0NEE2_9ACTN|nr:DUF4132 domain-containing protein [Actinomadura chibensis]TYB42776.1 DUF4132 domain-containing protein [Actinomadura chibensis]
MLHDTLAAEARADDGLDGIRLAALDRSRPLLSVLERQRAHEWTSEVAARDGWDEYERVKEALQAEFDLQLAARTEADDTGADDARAAVIALMLAARHDAAVFHAHGDAMRDTAARAGGWTPGEAAALLGCVAERPWHAVSLGIALTVVERLDGDGLREVAGPLRGAERGLVGATVATAERTAVERRLRALLARLDEAHIPDGLIPPYDPWAAALRERARGGDIEFARLVRHLASLSSPRPSRKWSRTCVALTDAADARDAVAETLRALAEDPALSHREHGDHYHYLVHQRHGNLARGLLWAAALTGGPEAVRRLGALALRAGAPGGDVDDGLKVAGAAINALAACGDGALAALWPLRTKIKNRALRKQLDTALQAVAERQGITAAQLVERGVPSHGLGPDGAVERTLGEHTARIAVEDAATVRLTFTARGRTSRTAPAAVKAGFPDELKELKALAKEVRATLSTERARIEALMSEDRVWPYGEWREHYRDHPVTGVVVRGLIWEFEDDRGEWHAVLGAPDGDYARVRLWHPIRASVDEVRAWRERIVDARVRQPFKQAFREIYLLTPAEEETATYSNRFAAHIVHYRRLYALFKERGWRSNFLGGYEGGYSGEARGEFGGGEWRACFYHEPVENVAWGPEHATTDQVRFERRDGRAWRETPLSGVPAVVFSEAMRDVDLFVGVTSIAADPEWADRGEDRFAAYWRETTFGELTASAEVRRAALERLLPRTRIAGRCAVDGRYLVVRGELRTYKIHLGSANVLMEPDDAYLCIVQGRRGQGKVFLPFEDERLSLILSKAFLLAADDRIEDESILLQIKRGA